MVIKNVYTDTKNDRSMVIKNVRSMVIKNDRSMVIKNKVRYFLIFNIF